MAIICDLCGGSLQVVADGSRAECTVCGLRYSMELLRMKMGQKPQLDPVDIVLTPATTYGRRVDASMIAGVPAFEPLMIMITLGTGIFGTFDRRGLHGLVMSGCVSNCDKVYVNQNREKAYTVILNQDDEVVRKGKPVKLDLPDCPKAVKGSAMQLFGSPYPSGIHYPGTKEQFFAYVVLNAFPEWEVYADARIPGVEIPVSFLFVRNGQPALAVFLLDSTDGKARWRVEKAMEACAARGIANMQFFTDYRNEYEYVADRIRNALGD